MRPLSVLQSAPSPRRRRYGGTEESWDSLLPYHCCVALADGDVVGRSLHIHTSDGESCGDETEESEKRHLQLPPARLTSDLHFRGGERTWRAI